jgi:hypothetical protein
MIPSGTISPPGEVSIQWEIMGRCQNHDFKYHWTTISLSGHSRTLPNEHLTIRAFTNIDTNKKNCMMKVLFPLISELSVLLYKHSLRRVPLVKQVLVILPGFSGIHVTRSFMCVLWIVVCPFVLFLLVIVSSVLLRFTDSGYPFGIF